MVQAKRRFLVCLLALVLMLGAAGCSAASAAEKAQSDTKAAGQPDKSDRQAISDYLKAARIELELIDEIIADKELGILEEEVDSEEELTVEQVAQYEKILSGYTGRIQTVLSAIDKRTAPDLSDILSFQTAEKAAFRTLDSILQEYGQALSYTGTLLTVFEDFENMENIQAADLQAVYDAYSAGIGTAIATLEAENVPSFFESFNQDFVDVLGQMDDAVFYMLSALAVDDPVRADAAGYLMEILGRRADEIGQRGVQDLTDREEMLKKDALAVQETSQGLKRWLDTNIDKLDGQ